MLKPISEEQEFIVRNLGDKNVLVEAVAGSGKTTTILYVAQRLSVRRVLNLTYNSKLRLETKERAKQLELNNLEVHTFHSFAKRYLQMSGYTDMDLISVLRDDPSNLAMQNHWDIIVVDEAQDLTSHYFRLVSMAVIGNPTAAICLMGDRYQNIYRYNSASVRYMLSGPKLFDNDRPWINANLSTTFRLTQEMCSFVNHCVLHTETGRAPMRAIKAGVKPRYYVIDCLSQKLCRKDDVFVEQLCALPVEQRRRYWTDTRNIAYIIERVNKGTLSELFLIVLEIAVKEPGDVFVLAPSVRIKEVDSTKDKKEKEKPVINLFNLANKLTLLGLNLYIPRNDDEPLDQSMLSGKVVFSTFHQAKGLERKKVIVFNFDQSYFKYYCPEPDSRCPNPLYVALTRAKEELIVVHHKTNDFLRFLNREIILNYITVPDPGRFQKKLSKMPVETQRNKKIPDLLGVTDLLRHINPECILECINIVDSTQVIEPGLRFELTGRTSQKETLESVCDLNGLASCALFEFNTLKRITIRERLVSQALRLRAELAKADFRTLYLSFLDDVCADDFYERFAKLTLKKQSKSLLIMANLYQYSMDNFLFRLRQIQKYDWLQYGQLALCTQRLEKDVVFQTIEFERKLSVEYKVGEYNFMIAGTIDIETINEDGLHTIWEIKTVKELKREHFLQLAVYAFLYERLAPEYPRRYRLYNVCTCECWELDPAASDLAGVINTLIHNKYLREDAEPDIPDEPIKIEKKERELKEHHFETANINFADFED